MIRTMKVGLAGLLVAITLAFSPTPSSAALPDWLRPIIACACCLYNGGDYCCHVCLDGTPAGGSNPGDVAQVAVSGWLSSMNDCVAANGMQGMTACRNSIMAATAPGHSWSLAWNPGTKVLTVTNTGATRDTACLMVVGAKSTTFDLTAAQAVVAVNASASANVSFAGTQAGQNGREFVVVSATGTGLNGDGFAELEIPNAAPGMSPAGLIVLSLLLLGATVWTLKFARRRNLGSEIA